MKGLCKAVKNAIDSGQYKAIYVICENFDQSIEATHALIDSGIIGHGESGASKAVCKGETWGGEELLYLYIKHLDKRPRLEYFYRYPTGAADICMIHFMEFDDEEDIQIPDIGAFLGI